MHQSVFMVFIFSTMPVLRLWASVAKGKEETLDLCVKVPDEEHHVKYLKSFIV